MFTDKSGEFIWFAVAIGALINMTTAAIQGKSFGQVLLAGAIGAAAGIVGGGFANLAVGGAFFSNAAAGVIGFGQGFIAGAAGGFAGGFVGGAGNAWMNGASFTQGLGAGALTGLMGGITGGLVGGITGGIRANKAGMDFWKGSNVIDSNKVNSPVNTILRLEEENAIASTNEFDFKNGDNLRDFKANFSGKDDYFQAIKALKKASIYNGSKLSDLYDFKSMDGWIKNGWKQTGVGGDLIYKDFFDHSQRFTLFSKGSFNYSTNGLGIDRLGSLGSHIYIEYGIRSYSQATPLAQWIFTDIKDIHHPVIQAYYNYLIK